MAAGFDRVARIYRWGEYISFGPLLARTRRAHVDALRESRRTLVLGDGDGRFLELALRTSTSLRATAVDVSRVMLKLLRQRCRAYAGRLTTMQMDARDASLSLRGYDTVVAHFFLDCLSDADVEQVVDRAADARMWVVSDFAVPGGVLRLPAAALIRGLYLGFRLLTGLQTQRLPRWGEALEKQGFRCTRRWSTLGGILFSEVWERDR